MFYSALLSSFRHVFTETSERGSAVWAIALFPIQSPIIFLEGNAGRAGNGGLRIFVEIVDQASALFEITSVPIKYIGESHFGGSDAVESGVTDKLACLLLKESLDVGGCVGFVQEGWARFGGAVHSKVNTGFFEFATKNGVLNLIEAVGSTRDCDEFFVPRLFHLLDAADWKMREDGLDGVGIVGIDPVGELFIV